MWCDFVAAGIGGRTIAEAKRNMTLHELHLWKQYRHKGLLITARTQEIAAARIVQAVVGGGSLYDYIPDRCEDRPGPSVEQAMALLGGTLVE